MNTSVSLHVKVSLGAVSHFTPGKSKTTTFRVIDIRNVTIMDTSFGPYLKASFAESFSLEV